MDENYSPVLAMYDIRGKQEFIFRNQHIKEIIGGSAIIRDCYADYLKPCAEKYGKGIFGRMTMKKIFLLQKRILWSILRVDISER